MSLLHDGSRAPQLAAIANHLSSVFDCRVQVSAWQEGFDFYADRATAPEWTRVVLSPRMETVNTSYEGAVDFGDVLVGQEHAYGAARRGGLVVPLVHYVAHRDNNPSGHSLLVLDLVPDDGSWNETTERELGAQLSLLHNLVGPSMSQSHRSWTEVVSARLAMRLGAAKAHIQLAVPDYRTRIGSLLDSSRPTDAFLHLDVRRPNLRVSDGHLLGIIDFASHTSGDPLFELARVRFCGLLTDAFLWGTA